MPLCVGTFGYGKATVFIKRSGIEVCIRCWDDVDEKYTDR